MRFPTTAVLGALWQKALISLAHPTRFERVTFAFGGQRSLKKVRLASKQVYNGCTTSPRCFIGAVAVGKKSAAVDVRKPSNGCCGRLYARALWCSHRRGSLHAGVSPFEFAREGGILPYSRRGKRKKSSHVVTHPFRNLNI